MDLDAFILIGGRSSRLGVDKAFVELGGETLAARSVDTIKKTFSLSRITFVARDENQFTSDRFSALGHPVISDLNLGFGAWSGIDAALTHARSEWIFILACDLPFVSVELLKLLAGFAGGETDAVVPRQPDGRLQPLCAFFRTEPTVAVVESMLGGYKSLPPLNAILENLKTRTVEPDEYNDLHDAAKLFLNINTENDLAAALA